MSGISFSRDVSGITLEASYFMPGICLIVLGMLMFGPLVGDFKVNTVRMAPT